MAAEGEEPKSESKDLAHHALIQPTAPEQFANHGNYTFVKPAPPWYTDLHTVFMLCFLLFTLFGGGFFLIQLCFTTNVLKIFGVILGFLALTMAGLVIRSYMTKYV